MCKAWKHAVKSLRIVQVWLGESLPAWSVTYRKILWLEYTECLLCLVRSCPCCSSEASSNGVRHKLLLSGWQLFRFGAWDAPQIQLISAHWKWIQWIQLVFLFLLNLECGQNLLLLSRISKKLAFGRSLRVWSTDIFRKIECGLPWGLCMKALTREYARKTLKCFAGKAFFN